MNLSHLRLPLSSGRWCWGNLWISMKRETSEEIRALAPGDHLEYEAVLNDFSAGRFLALCQYPVHRFPPLLLLYVPRTHPRIMIGEKIYDNPHYHQAIGRVVR